MTQQPVESAAPVGIPAEQALRLEELLRSSTDRQDLSELRSILANSSFSLPPASAQRALLSSTIERGFCAGAITLINHGVGLGYPDPSGSSPLFMAARIGDVLVCRALIERGVRPDEPSMHGASALSEAARCGHLDVCAYLLQSGANPNAMSKLKRTPLHKAVAGMSLECCKLLIAAGADAGFVPPGELSARYLTPFQFAIAYSSTSVASYFIDSFPGLLSSKTANGTCAEELTDGSNRRLVLAALAAQAILKGLDHGLANHEPSSTSKGLSPL